MIDGRGHYKLCLLKQKIVTFVGNGEYYSLTASIQAIRGS